jgi:3-phosphoshikimate 1-carboxyvinyltransferase
MEFLDLPPMARVAGTVRLPGSKSISNRTLLLAAIASGTTHIRGLLDAEDVDFMLEALRTLGVRVDRRSDAERVDVRGAGGALPVKRASLFLGNAGTALRPLTAALAFSKGDYVLDGAPRMRERPIRDLVDALRSLGADVRYSGSDGFPPLAIKPGMIHVSDVTMRGDVSSQFLTAMLMALPIVGGGATIEIAGELISKPYIDITLKLMQRFGVAVEREGWTRFRVPDRSAYVSPGTIAVEGDASSASYFLAAGAIAGGPVRVQGISRDSTQGDAAFADTLAAMGAIVRAGNDWIEVRGSGHLVGIDADFNAIPDAAMTAAATALFAEGPTTLRNIGSWRVKETDRIAAMAHELAKLGAVCEQGPDWLRVVPPRQLLPATIDTYDDHRMAMSLSLAALGGVTIRINDPDCVRKTFPDYFAEFQRLALRP